MPSLTINNQYMIKYRLNWLFDELAERNWLTCLRISCDLEREVAKYYITRGEYKNDFQKKITNLQYALCSGWGQYRFEMAMDALTELAQFLQADRNAWNSGNPYDQIRKIYYALQEDVPIMLSSGEPDDVDAVRQDLQALTNPRLEAAFNKLQEQGDFYGYQMYKKILQYQGQAMGGIMKITPYTVNNIGNVASVVNDFKLLFMTMASILAKREMITTEVKNGKIKESVFAEESAMDEKTLTEKVLKLYDEGYDKLEIAEELGQDVAYIDYILSSVSPSMGENKENEEGENEDEL